MDKVFLLFISIIAAVIVLTVSLKLAWWIVLLSIFVTYCIIVFLLSRIVISHIGFVKEALPKTIHPELEEVIKSIQGTQEQAIKQAYKLVTQQLHGESGKTFLRMSKLFRSHDEKLWREGGYANCHTMNYYLRLFLVKSKTCTDDDIKLIHRVHKYNIHQYLKIRVGRRWMVLDPGFAYAQIPFARKNDYWWKKGYKEERYEGLYLQTKK